MSLKGIELQIAIPKTFDAGKLAEQKQQRIQVMQDQANLQTEKQAEKDKEVVLESEKYEKLNPDEKEKREKERQEKEGKERQKEGKKKTRHPYKGSFVDFNG